MGNFFTVDMEENLLQNQDLINEITAIKIERDIQMRSQLREREVALEIAKQRELFFWYGAFYLTAATWSALGFRYKRKVSVFAPLIPLSFLMAYQTDLAYGTKLHRIIVEAERILQFEPEIVQLPLKVPTAASLDLRRAEIRDQKKLHPSVTPK
ncbi:plasminogen receptor (KT) [Coccinella septempunctata]|uniref:plasminogen receptor (KT) n=1 Tax=Coccinella septempunctata TaxID=41139 RepID=UPI001D06805B|nr:plasminogen receptor (KT) [Coccinella septempunctata]